MSKNYISEEVYDSICQTLEIDRNILSVALNMENKSLSSVIHDLLQEVRRGPYRTLAIELARQLPAEHSVDVKLEHGRWADYEFPSELKEHIEKNIDKKTILYLMEILEGEYKKNKNDWELINNTVDLLEEVRPAGALEYLLKLLEDTGIDFEIQPSLINIIGKYRDSKAIMPLLRVMLRDDELVEDVIMALGDIANPKATSVLLKLSKSKAFSHRRAAFRALGEIKDPQSINFLAKRFNESSTSPVDRKEIAVALMKLGDIKILGMFLDKYIETNNLEF